MLKSIIDNNNIKDDIKYPSNKKTSKKSKSKTKSKTKTKTKTKSKIDPKKVKQIKDELKKESTNNNISDKSSKPENKEGDMFSMFMKHVNTSNMDLTEKDITSLENNVSTLYNSEMAIVKNCNPSTCEQINICPFNAIKKYPTGKLCPVELSIVEFMNKEYYKLLYEETEREEFNIIEMSTIRAIIELELEEFRARVLSNKDGMLKRNATFVIKDTGEVIYNDIENPVYNLRERFDRRKSKLLQRLLITPDTKARFGIDNRIRSKKSNTDLISSAEEKIKKIQDQTKDNTKTSG